MDADFLPLLNLPPGSQHNRQVVWIHCKTAGSVFAIFQAPRLDGWPRLSNVREVRGLTRVSAIGYTAVAGQGEEGVEGSASAHENWKRKRSQPPLGVFLEAETDTVDADNAYESVNQGVFNIGAHTLDYVDHISLKYKYW